MNRRSTASEHTIVRRSAEVLGLSTLTVDELADRLVAEGLDLGSDPADLVHRTLLHNPEFYDVGERILHVRAQLDGTSWCTIAEPGLAADGLLAVDPDLTVLGWWLFENARPLVDSDGTPAGGSVRCEADDEGAEVLIGPPGWLEPHQGRHVAVRCVGEGVHLEPVGQPPTASRSLVEAVRAGFISASFEFADWDDDERIGGEPDDPSYTFVSRLLWHALVAERQAFLDGPVPPIDSVLTVAGLERKGQLVAAAGFDWVEFDRRQRQVRVATAYRLDDDGSERLAMLMAASSTMIDGDIDGLGPQDQRERSALVLARCLADPKVCQAFLGEHTAEQTDLDGLLGFARLLLAAGDGLGSGGPAYVAATCLDRLGRPAEAEDVLTFSAGHDDHPLSLALLASLRADRGDGVGAVSLLHRAEVTGDGPGLGAEVFREVAGYAAHRPRALANRNAPCPCGSGRKYKACHLGKERHALIDRAPWLHMKARRFVWLHERDLNGRLAERIARVSGQGWSYVKQLLDSELVADITLCEGGVWARFLAERHELLPDDEALLAARWQLVERSLFEVERAGPDRLHLRDVRTGDRIEVTNTRNDRQSSPGTMLLGRPVPVDDTWRAYSGFVVVSGVFVQAVLDALDERDPFALAEVIGRCFAPPTIQNTDGQPLHFHEITWRIDDVAATRTALDDGVLTANPDGTYALVRNSANQNDTVIASCKLADPMLADPTPVGPTLTAEVNSDERADEIILLISRLLPTAVMVDHDMWDLDEMRGYDGDDDDDDDGSPWPDLSDPAIRSMVAQYVEQFEQRWLDESIPALGGATPREAAADPIGRHELERLLRSFPDEDHPGAMSPKRLRAALGL